MKGYISKQLEEQIGKMINDLAEGNVAQVENRFGAVEKFVLCDEKKFIDGIPHDMEKRDKKLEEMKENFIKTLEKALEHENLDDKVNHAIQCYHTLDQTQQGIMGEFFTDLVQSVVSYKRNVVDKDHNAGSGSIGKVVDFEPVKDSSDEIDKVLDKK